MTTPQDAKIAAARTYNAAADAYDDPANTFWERFGQSTVERLALQRGGRVLDVCCGSGASAIPAARIVGPIGHVLGVDLAENLLGLARQKAARLGLCHAEFRTGDMLDLRLGEAAFDAVVCVFGIFFVPDMASAVRELWRCVRPGGKVAITTWGPRFFEPATTAFWRSIQEVRPDLYKGFNPWDRISEPAALREVLGAGGVTVAEIVAQAGQHPITSPEAWWAAVMGSGYRGTVDKLSEQEFAHVRSANLDYISQSGIRSVESNVIFAVARKPVATR